MIPRTVVPSGRGRLESRVERTRGWSCRVRAAGLACLTLVLATVGVEAQTADAIAAGCSAAGGDAALCAATAAAGLAVGGQSSLLAGLGSPLPGTASNLGTRVGGGPKLTLFGRAGALRLNAPDLGSGDGLRESSSIVPVVHVGAAVGLFDGFRLVPTVGGFLSADVIGQLGFIRLPISEGFAGGVTSYSLGLRMGIFREGFTIPGVSVALSRRFLPEISYASDVGSALPAVRIDPAVTSLRATVGKDLLAVEFLAGFGWDRMSGDALLRVTDGVATAVTHPGEIDADRLLYFASAATTLSIVLSLVVEAGWVQGFDPVSAYGGAYDSTTGSAFGSFSVRLNM